MLLNAKRCAQEKVYRGVFVIMEVHCWIYITTENLTHEVPAVMEPAGRGR